MSQSISGEFRLAIVGAGLITQNVHLPTALSLPNVRVVALVDPVAGRATELARRYGIQVQVAGDAEELREGIDGAIIATPNDTHRGIAAPLLERGISTLIEKPLATTVEDAESIVAAGRRGNARIAVGYYQRFLDGPCLLQRLLATSHFGTVSRFYHQYGTAGGWAAMSGYTLRREAIGGGVLVVTGTHFLDRMLGLWGDPDIVSLEDDSHGGPEAHCVASVEYRSRRPEALSGQLRYSKRVALPPGLVIESQAGTVVLRDGQDDDVVLIPADQPDLRLNVRSASEEGTTARMNAWQRMLCDFIDACVNCRPPEVDGEQGLASVRLLQRFYTNRRAMSEPDGSGIRA